MSSKKSVAKTALVAYVPALHAGYRSFFERHSNVHLFLLGKSLVSLTPRMERDIRALSAEDIQKALIGIGIESVSVIEKENIRQALKPYTKFILPREDVSEHVAQKYLKRRRVIYDNVFLRWDKKISTTEFTISPDRVVSKKNADLRMLSVAAREAAKSPDWWRQIGAVLVKGKRIRLCAYNRHLPHNYVTDILGDPRSNFDYGEHPEVYLSIHAEADIVAQAAEKGISLRGADVYVTTFPCSNCARLLTRAGVRKVFYSKGYSSFDAEKILHSAGVEIILVDDKKKHRP